MTYLEWTCDLDRGFAAPAELLSLTFPTQVGSHDATIHLPSPPVDPAAWYLTQSTPWGAGDPSEEWGMVLERRGGCVQRVAVSRLLLTARVVGAEAEIQRAAEEIQSERNNWASNLQTWLEVVTGQQLTPIGHRKPRVIGNLPIWHASAEQSRREPITFPGRMGITLERLPVADVTTELLTGCSSLAPGHPPELAWLLLRDARALSAVGQHRRAIIDAATAAELAITRMLDTLLDRLDAEECEALRKKHQTLGGKIELVESRIRPLPADLYENLVARRNDAVHEGRAIGAGTCDLAIEAAATVVELAHPLPAVLGARRWPVRNPTGAHTPGTDDEGEDT